MHIRIDLQAELELEEAAEFYEIRRENLGLEFIEAFELGIRRIAQNPERYALLPEQHLRAYPLGRFPYSILYRIDTDDSIFVAAVAHQSRRPGYWKDRLKDV